MINMISPISCCLWWHCIFLRRMPSWLLHWIRSWRWMFDEIDRRPIGGMSIKNPANSANKKVAEIQSNISRLTWKTYLRLMKKATKRNCQKPSKPKRRMNTAKCSSWFPDHPLKNKGTEINQNQTNNEPKNRYPGSWVVVVVTYWFMTIVIIPKMHKSHEIALLHLHLSVTVGNWSSTCTVQNPFVDI